MTDSLSAVSQSEQKKEDFALAEREGAEPHSLAAPPPQKGAKTLGEKRFRMLNILMDYTVTFVASVGLGYLFRHSSRTAFLSKTGESWKDFSSRKEHELANSSLLTPLKGAKIFDNKKVAEIFVDTLTTFPGGFVTLPIMHYMDQHKQKIVHWFNQRSSTPEEVARGDANTADHIVPSWTHLLEGRMTSFAIVFASFMGLEAVIADKMKTVTDLSEEATLKAGQKASNILTGKPLSEKNANRFGKTGRVIAFDSIASLASVVFTYVSSHFFAQKAHDRCVKTVEAHQKKQETAPLSPPMDEKSPQDIPLQAELKTESAKQPSSETPLRAKLERYSRHTASSIQPRGKYQTRQSYPEEQTTSNSLS
jgi:hypothetical protein